MAPGTRGSATLTTSQIEAIGRLAREDDGSSSHSRRLKARLDEADRRLAPATAVLRRWHGLLLLLSAFGRHPAVVRAARASLRRFEPRVKRLTPRARATLIDTGIIGTQTQYTFGYETLRTLTSFCPGECRIDWDQFESPESLDPILYRIALRAEHQTLDDGLCTTQEWIDLARRRPSRSPARRRTDLDWLVGEIEAMGLGRDAAIATFDGAEVPIRWNLIASRGSSTLLRLHDAARMTARGPLRRPLDAARLMAAPMLIPSPLPPHRAIEVRAVANAALAARGREVHAMRYANLDEIYLIDLGEHTALAVLGVEPAHRLPLEANYGYMLFARGVPVGYGGVSPLFRQGNTGINIFEEFRGSEAAMLFALTLRAFHSLFGVQHFIVSPYQFGADNEEAIESGAFWFYHRLGFRPVSRSVRAVADREWRRLSADRSHRTRPEILERLARSDLRLSLPGSDPRDLFAEANLARLASKITDSIARGSAPDRASAAERMAERVAVRVGITGRHLRTSAQRESLSRLAPIVSVMSSRLARWSPALRARLRVILLSKCDRRERPFARALGEHDRLRRDLSAALRA